MGEQTKRERLRDNKTSKSDQYAVVHVGRIADVHIGRVTVRHDDLPRDEGTLTCDDALTTHLYLSGRVWQTPERLAQTRLGAIPKFQKKGSAILLV